MKKFALLLFMTGLSGTANSQKDTSWKVHGFCGVNTSQTALSNWQGGGQDNLTIGSIFNLEAIYSRDEFEQWTNKLDAQFGMVRPGYGKNMRKNIDQLFFLSKYNSRAFSKAWYWSAQADYRTQFSPGYKYQGDTTVGDAVSDFNSPGYIQLALGLDFKPKDYFSVTFAPVAGKVTMVNRQYLADAGAYGVEKATMDDTGKLIPGKTTRFEFGGRVIVKFKKDIFTNVNLDSYLDLFTNYMVKPGNFDVIFNNLLTFKINKYFTANIISQILYDDDITVTRDLDKNGQSNLEGEFSGPRVQALTTLAIGFGYKF